MRPIVRQLLNQPVGFSPRQLFSALQGAWLEPVVGSIWQEHTGVTPTTTGGQTIGLLLDQSQGSVTGPELVTNGTFDKDTTGWARSRGGTLSVVSGALRITGDGGTQIGATTTLSTSVGRWYKFSCTYNAGTSSTGILLRAASDQNLGTLALTVTYASGSGSFVGYFFATAATMYVGCLSTDTVAGRYIEIDNVSVREILGNHAYQATAANRPLLGRRYNLLTYSALLGGVSGTPGTAPTGWTQFISGTPTATFGVDDEVASGATIRLTTSQATGDRAQYSQTINVDADKSYRLSTIVDVVLGHQIGISHITFITPPAGSTLTYTLDGNTVTSATFIPSGRHTITCNLVVGATGGTAQARIGAGISAAVNADITFRRPDLRLAADVGKDPTYQRITTATDYDYGQYPAAVHDSTDSLVVSLPSVNARRNLLTWSESFDNATWTKQTASVAISGLSSFARAAYKITPTGGSSGYDNRVFNPVSCELGITYRLSVYARSSAVTPKLTLALQNMGGQIFNITPEWQRYGVSVLCTSAGIRNYNIYAGSVTFATGVVNSSNEIEIFGAQLELGSTATDYQKITDWTSEAYASSGSVYFATPVGMSALHNQSMGTTYTLPALSTDIYSWIVVPQRLNTAQENRLARYMERKAGIAGPDYFEQEDYGPELASNISGFTDLYGGGSLTGDKSFASTGAGGVSRYFLTLGKTYVLSLSYTQTNAVEFSVNNYPGAKQNTLYASSGLNGAVTVTFLATTISIYLRLAASSAVTISAVSVRELKDGMTGQLTADDGTELLLAQ